LETQEHYGRSPILDLVKSSGELDGSATGLNLPPGMTFEEWSEVGHKLARINRAWRWWAGDWLHYGEQAFGEMAAQAMNDLGVDYQTLANCAWVAGKIPPSRRRENLSWSHHEAIAGMDDPIAADTLLDQAENQHLTTKDLRVLVKGPKDVPEPESTPVLEQPLLTFCPPEMTTAQIVAGALRVCFPDAATALDVTYGNGAFWDGSAHVNVTGIDVEEARAPDGVGNFRELSFSTESFDVVLFDPPHLADAGDESIMGNRFGTYLDVDLPTVVQEGVAEAFRVAKLGIVVKVTDAVHGQELVLMSDWVRQVAHTVTGSSRPYQVVHQVRERSMVDPKWNEQCSAYNNGSTYLIFRKGDQKHVRRG